MLRCRDRAATALANGAEGKARSFSTAASRAARHKVVTPTDYHSRPTDLLEDAQGPPQFLEENRGFGVHIDTGDDVAFQIQHEGPLDARPREHPIHPRMTYYNYAKMIHRDSVRILRSKYLAEHRKRMELVNAEVERRLEIERKRSELRAGWREQVRRESQRKQALERHKAAVLRAQRQQEHAKRREAREAHRAAIDRDVVRRLLKDREDGWLVQDSDITPEIFDHETVPTGWWPPNLIRMETDISHPFFPDSSDHQFFLTRVPPAMQPERSSSPVGSPQSTTGGSGGSTNVGGGSDVRVDSSGRKVYRSFPEALERELEHERAIHHTNDHLGEEDREGIASAEDDDEMIARERALQSDNRRPVRPQRPSAGPPAPQFDDINGVVLRRARIESTYTDAEISQVIKEADSAKVQDGAQRALQVANDTKKSIDKATQEVLENTMQVEAVWQASSEKRAFDAMVATEAAKGEMSSQMMEELAAYEQHLRGRVYGHHIDSLRKRKAMVARSLQPRHRRRYREEEVSSEELDNYYVRAGGEPIIGQRNLETAKRLDELSIADPEFKADAHLDVTTGVSAPEPVPLNYVTTGEALRKMMSHDVGYSDRSDDDENRVRAYMRSHITADDDARYEALNSRAIPPRRKTQWMDTDEDDDANKAPKTGAGEYILMKVGRHAEPNITGSGFAFGKERTSPKDIMPSSSSSSNRGDKDGDVDDGDSVLLEASSLANIQSLKRDRNVDDMGVGDGDGEVEGGSGSGGSRGRRSGSSSSSASKSGSSSSSTSQFGSGSKDGSNTFITGVGRMGEAEHRMMLEDPAEFIKKMREMDKGVIEQLEVDNQLRQKLKSDNLTHPDRHLTPTDAGFARRLMMVHNVDPDTGTYEGKVEETLTSPLTVSREDVGMVVKKTLQTKIPGQLNSLKAKKAQELKDQIEGDSISTSKKNDTDGNK